MSDKKEAFQNDKKSIGLMRSFGEKIEKEIVKWDAIKKDLSSFREITQFLEIFSSEDIREINGNEREIAKMIEGLKKISQAVFTEEPEFLPAEWVLNSFEFLEFNHEAMQEAQFFIATKRSKVYNIKPNLGNFLFCPFSTVRFLIEGYLHKKTMKIIELLRKK